MIGAQVSQNILLKLLMPGGGQIQAQQCHVSVAHMRAAQMSYNVTPAIYVTAALRG
jgi:hypothetical protein